MKVFHALAYEGYVIADASSPIVFSDPSLMEPIGAVDVLHVSGYSAQVTGTTPKLTVSVNYSNEGSYFIPINPFIPVINQLDLSTSGETLFQGVNPGPEVPRLAYGKLSIELTGTNARAFLRIWVTGRDRSRRAAGLMPGRSFGAMKMTPTV